MRIRSLILAVLFFFPALAIADETLITTGGSSTWTDAGLSGAKIPGTNAATVTVKTSESVNASITATVTYQIGQTVDGKFNELAKYTRNLTAGNNQDVSNTFSGMAQAVQYTVKAKTEYSDKSSNVHTDKTITVAP